MTLQWNVVLECPKCGQQMGSDAASMQMWCSMGHERTEMEQKLPQAFDGPTPQDVEREGEERP